MNLLYMEVELFFSQVALLCHSSIYLIKNNQPDYWRQDNANALTIYNLCQGFFLPDRKKQFASGDWQRCSVVQTEKGGNITPSSRNIGKYWTADCSCVLTHIFIHELFFKTGHLIFGFQLKMLIINFNFNFKLIQIMGFCKRVFTRWRHGVSAPSFEHIYLLLLS